jgi:hypothetical protein
MKTLLFPQFMVGQMEKGESQKKWLCGVQLGLIRDKMLSGSLAFFFIATLICT